MKTKLLCSAILLGVLGLGHGGKLDAASGGGTVFPWIGYLPDLYVSSLYKLDYGTHVAVSFTVRNGGLSAAGPFTVTRLSQTGVSNISYGQLGAGQSRSLWLWIPKSSIPSGTQVFLAVDSMFDVGESNEGNNLAVFTMP